MITLLVLWAAGEHVRLFPENQTLVKLDKPKVIAGMVMVGDNESEQPLVYL